MAVVNQSPLELERSLTSQWPASLGTFFFLPFRFNPFWELCTKGARIFKRLRGPGTDSEESIPPTYVDWRAGIRQIGLRHRPAGWELIPGLL